jgi:hypothetical protein
MNKAKLIIWIFLILIIVSCQKEKVDFRDLYIGAYKFTVISYLESNNYLNGQWDKEIFNDTINYIGSIEKFETNRLKIDFLPYSSEPISDAIYFPVKINGLIYPEIFYNDSMTYLDFEKIYEERFFDGYFKGDSVFIKYWCSGGHSGYQTVNIKGLRIK